MRVRRTLLYAALFLLGAVGLVREIEPLIAWATTTIDAAQVNISGTFNSPTIGPNASQQHVLPAVSSDTVALLAASQTLSAKTLASPIISGTTTGTYTIGGTPTITAAAVTNTITAYNGDTTAGNGLASVLGSVKLTAQTAAITATTLFTPAVIGLYAVDYYVVVTSTGTSTDLVLTLTHTDNAAARTRTAATVSCAATNTTSGRFVMQSTASAIQYATTQTGTCTYSLYLSLTRLN